MYYIYNIVIIYCPAALKPNELVYTMTIIYPLTYVYKLSLSKNLLINKTRYHIKIIIIYCTIEDGLICIWGSDFPHPVDILLFLITGIPLLKLLLEKLTLLLFLPSLLFPCRDGVC